MADTRREINDRWREKNKERTKYLNKRSHARGFIRDMATPEDLEELKRMIQEREKENKNLR